MLNRAQLIGHVGQAPEIRNTSSGEKVASFSLATSESWKDKATGEKKEKTEWHKIVVFGARVAVVESFVKKGVKIFVEGKLQTRKWKDKDGNDKNTTEIVLQNFEGKIQILDISKTDAFGEAKANAFVEENDGDDAIPF